MSTFSIPDSAGNIVQANKGEAVGNIFLSHGVDFSSEEGRIIPSPILKNIFDETDDADFDNPIIKFLFFNNTWWGIADVLFKSTTGYADSAWSQDATASSPSGNWKEMDGEVFNSKLLVSGTGAAEDDIYAYNGSAWSSWWKGTLAQTALDATVFKPIKEGANGRLYILDAQQKVYNVTTASVVTKTGNGTLDFSATSYKFLCMEPSSSRMWLGGTDIARGRAVIAEWDMSLNSATPNKIHVIKGARSVVAMPVWDDIPYPVLSNGDMYVFNGSSFEPVKNGRLPRPPFGYAYRGDLSGSSSLTVDAGIMHPNGWDIVDGLPHIFLNTKIVNKSGTEAPPPWNAPAGAWCYDPAVGLYNRFAIARDADTSDYAASDISDVGALTFTGSAGSKFLSSAKVYSNSGSTTKTVLLIQDIERTLSARGWLATIPFQASRKDLWQKIEFMHSLLKNASDRIIAKYRLKKSTTLPAEMNVTWTSTTVFTSTDTDFANVVAGDEIMVIRGDGSGCTSQISTITYANPTYTVTLVDPVFAVSNGETGVVRIDNWKLLATISAQLVDYHGFTIPSSEDTVKMWVKLEFRTAASSQIELDRMIISSKAQQK